MIRRSTCRVNTIIMRQFARPVLLNKLKTMAKYKDPHYHGYITKGCEYGFKVRRNGLIDVVNFQKGNKTIITGVHPNTIFNKRMNRNAKAYIQNSISRMRVNKVNVTNKTDPITLHNFKNGEYAYKVKTGNMVAYYQTKTVHKLSNVPTKLEFNAISGSKKVFNNPLLGYNNQGQRFPVYRRNVTRVRMVKPHKVKTF